MNTNTNTNTTVPSDAQDLIDQGEELAWWVDGDHPGFSFEPDMAVGDAVANMLVVEATGFDAALAAARRLAAADDASKLSPPERAKLASDVRVTWADRPGYVATMTGSTYSKRCKVGRASDDQVLAFLLVCDSPSLNKLYEWLPKDAAMSKPRAPKAGKVSSPKVEPEPEQDDDAADDEPKAPCRWDAEHVSTAARAAIAALVTQGADAVTQRLVAAEMTRLLSPVRSADAPAA